MSLISKSHLRFILKNIKALLSKKADKSDIVQSDWNQNNEDAIDYVKNRTHWEEDPREIEILPEMTIEGFAIMQEPIYAVTNAFTITPNLGQIYTVMWDGVKYDVEYKDFDGLGCLGNENYVDMNSGGDIPFALIFANDVIFVATESTAASHTISISTIEAPVHHLDPKYIKDMYHEYMAPNRDIIIWEQTITAEDDYSVIEGIEIENFLTEGATYIVTWNDQTYTCTARYDNQGDLYIGNQLVGSEADGYEFPEVIESNEPFFFCTYEPDDWRSLIVQTAGEYNIEIVGTGEKLTPYQIDMKYIPDNIKYNIEDLWYDVNDLYNNIDGLYEEINNNTIANDALTIANTAKTMATDNAANMLTLAKITVKCSIGIDDITYGNGLFVGISKTSVAYSVDAIHWNTVDLTSYLTSFGTNYELNRIVYGNDRFVIVTNKPIMKKKLFALCSSDGINWSSNTVAFNLPQNVGGTAELAYGNDMFITAGTGSWASQVFYSRDGVTWTIVNISNLPSLIHMYFANDRFYLFGRSGVGFYSFDGLEWVQISLPVVSASITGLSYGNNKFVATIYSGGAMYSTDGIEWIAITLPSSIHYEDIIYTNGMFIIAASNNILYSINGDNWSVKSSGITGFITQLAYNDNKIIAATNSGDIIYSNDGVNWISTYKQIYQNGENVNDTIKNVLDITDPTLSIEGSAADAKAVGDALSAVKSYTEEQIADAIVSPQHYFTLIDDTTSYEYIIRMQNGNLTSVCKASSLAITTLPTKTTYTVGETLDLTDMVVTLTRQDGATEEVNNYSYTEPDMSAAGTVDVTVSYVEVGETYSATFAVTITEATTTEETETTT